MDNTARLLITSPDKPGIVAAVSNFLYSHNVNITALDQHSTDPEGGTFFMRLEFQTPYLNVTREALENAFGNVVAARYGMHWRIEYAGEPKRLAVLVSRQDHAMQELLWRWSRGDLPGEMALVISNHEDLRPSVEHFGIPFLHIPMSAATRAESEAAMLEAITAAGAGHVVLARFMQILSGDFVSHFPQRIINIHHSFLPAFAGADPYGQAYERGVKLIGATAHYVIEELDAGPIIDQDVVRVSHRHSVTELRELGREVERTVLARAVKWHLEDRIILHGNKTVVFA